MSFEKIKEHLQRKRDEVVIKEENSWMMKFVVKGKFFEKHFYVIDFKSPDIDLDATKNLRESRPMHKRYWMTFVQENYPQWGQFVTITNISWYASQEDVLETIKRFCRNWRR